MFTGAKQVTVKTVSCESMPHLQGVAYLASADCCHVKMRIQTFLFFPEEPETQLFLWSMTF